jgi:hypothetical protein
VSKYTAPEVRELGQVSTFTLGSSHGLPAVTKANNSTPDFFTAADPTNPANYGSPCTETSPLGNLDCSAP